MAKKLWPDKPLWQKAAAHPQYYLPIYANDFAPRIQAMAANMKKPPFRFGENPQTRMTAYAKHLSADTQIAIWFYPFTLLSVAMEREPK